MSRTPAICARCGEWRPVGCLDATHLRYCFTCWTRLGRPGKHHAEDNRFHRLREAPIAT